MRKTVFILTLLGLAFGVAPQGRAAGVPAPSPTEGAGGGAVHEPARRPRRVPRAVTVAVSVTEDGFVPSEIRARRGRPLRLVVTRRTDDTCARSIVVPEYHLSRDLPLGKPVSLTLIPRKAGTIHFACGMGMVQGTIQVR